MLQKVIELWYHSEQYIIALFKNASGMIPIEELT